MFGALSSFASSDVMCISVNKAVIMNMEYCYFHVIYLKKSVGADWTCTSAEYVVYILKKYMLIDGSVISSKLSWDT